jgi:hypothetical protein
MKQSIFRRYLPAVLALIVTAQLSIFNSVYAKAPQGQSDGSQTQGEYAPEELELIRTKMLELMDASKELAGLLPDPTNYFEQLEKARVQIEEYSSKDLTAIRKAIDPSRVNWNAIAKARQTLADYKSSELGIAQQKSRAARNSKGDFSLTSEGFPNASPFCYFDRLPPRRSSRRMSFTWAPRFLEI